MKWFLGLFVTLSLILGGFFGLGRPQPAIAAGLDSFVFQTQPVIAAGYYNSAERKLDVPFGESIDVNNSNARAFRTLPGMYPTIARKIIKNAPYSSVEDVLDIPDLSDREKEILSMHLSKLRATDPETALVEGGDRINNGIYK